MSIFNSLGSNYDFNFAVRCIFPQNKKDKELISFLEKNYRGQATLLYKGREAIRLALEKLDLPKESKVIINAFTCKAVWEAVEKAGYKYQFLDLGKDSLNFTPDNLSKMLETDSTIKVVVIQNTLGYPCDMEKIQKICREKNLILIEDLAHAIGTKYLNGQHAGTVGDMVTLSFSQDKMIDAVSGGALIIRNKKYQNIFQKELRTISAKQQLKDILYPLLTFKIRKTYDLGIGKPFHFLLKHFNLLSKPMTDIFYDTYSLPSRYCDSVLFAFGNFPENLKHRHLIANIYKNCLNKIFLYPGITENINNSSNLRFPIFTDNRKSLINYLKNYKIYVSDIWYDKVLPDYKNSFDVSQKILNLPTHKNVSEENARYICERINEWLKLQ